MASIIEGYSYDIFISYRQKDNRYDGWVTEFVDNLKKELEATFKEEVSVYFDINPHDGLLETHDVDESLKDKLKCLVFIPIISRTYCDPKSFAWEHEFKAFIEQASQDQFGLKVKLPYGNVASRILSVKIHDLDSEDNTLLENELGGVLRCIEFIYKSAGVNRPLRANEDHPQDNLNKTYYRDQINKVANAVKEIITAIKKYGQQEEKVPVESIITKLPQKKGQNKKIIIGSFLVVLLFALGYFFIPKLFESSGLVENSIAVLPFMNESPDETNSLFVISFTDEIRNNLMKINNFCVIGRPSSEYYNNLSLSPAEIAKKLDVNFLINGSGFKTGDIYRLTVTLTSAPKGILIWSHSYQVETRETKELWAIYLQIAEAIATELKAVITPQEKQLIVKTPTEDMTAYDAYLRGQFYINKWDLNTEALDTAMYYFELAKKKDPEYALAYAGISDVWTLRQQFMLISHAEAKSKAIPFLTKALELDSTSAEIYYSLGFLKQFLMWDWKGSETAYKKAIALNPNHAMVHVYYSNLLSLLGRHEEALEQIALALKLDPLNSLPKACYGVSLIFIRRYNDAIKTFQDALKINPTNNIALANVPLVLYLTGRFDEALESWKSLYSASYKDIAHAFDQGYKKAGIAGALTLEADTLVAQSKTSFIWPSDIYLLYILVGNKDRALEWMEKSYEAHENMNAYLLFPPIYDNLRNEPRYQELCRKMNLPYK
jgi:TolB-like protein